MLKPQKFAAGKMFSAAGDHEIVSRQKIGPRTTSSNYDVLGQHVDIRA